MPLSTPKKTRPPGPRKAGKGTLSTQQYLEIAEVRDGVLIMKDGTIRAVVLVSSMNFSLKSDDEQQAIIQGYISFLNTLDFPLQIVIQSRKLDISGYLNDLAEREKRQTNDLLRMQMADYRQFVGELVDLGEIMTKKFYVVVPYNPAADVKQGYFKQLAAVFSPSTAIHLKQEQFLELKHNLDQRVSNTMGGLIGMGLSAVQLDTQSLIELFYIAYNPDTAPQQKMVGLEELRIAEQ